MLGFAQREHSLSTAGSEPRLGPPGAAALPIDPPSRPSLISTFIATEHNQREFCFARNITECISVYKPNLWQTGWHSLKQERLSSSHLTAASLSSSPSTPYSSLSSHVPPLSSSSSSPMLSPLYQDHGGSVRAQTSSCSSASQGLHQPLRRRPPPISGSSVGPHPTYYHTVYDVRVEQYREVPLIGGVEGSAGGAHCGRGSAASGDTEPLALPTRRRGGVVDYRDVILAHQAHKLHNTPQARRKQWE